MDLLPFSNNSELLPGLIVVIFLPRVETVDRNVASDTLIIVVLPRVLVVVSSFIKVVSSTTKKEER